jgi:hypothetical protein
MLALLITERLAADGDSDGMIEFHERAPWRESDWLTPVALGLKGDAHWKTRWLGPHNLAIAMPKPTALLRQAPRSTISVGTQVMRRQSRRWHADTRAEPHPGAAHRDGIPQPHHTNGIKRRVRAR